MYPWPGVPGGRVCGRVRDRMSFSPGSFRHPHRPGHRCPLYGGSQSLDRACQERSALHRPVRASNGDAMNRNGPVVIVGSGQAGGRAAGALRQGGHSGRIPLIGEEAYTPYERPPLSKEFLSSAAAQSLAWVHPAAWYAESDVTLLSRTRAVAIDTVRGLVELDCGAPV